MSIWTRIINATNYGRQPAPTPVPQVTRDSSRYALIDIEVSMRDNQVHDIGAVRHDDAIFHNASPDGLMTFLQGIDYLCGHNIIHHDARYLFGDAPQPWLLVDTLYVSPLLFPERPYHRLVKDEKLLCDELNNPVNDCKKARELLFDEIEAWNALPPTKQAIFGALLSSIPEFSGFMSIVGASGWQNDTLARLRNFYHGRICQHANLDNLVEQRPIELAYALALIDTTDFRSITPGWVLRNYPEVENVIHLLRHTPCGQRCDYCDTRLDIRQNLEHFFGYKQFRTFDGENLQESAVQAAVNGQSLLTIFPTGGGKSLTFQLPALMAGQTMHSLTVVISPLQSLMKDQIDNLAERGIIDAVTINGMLDPLSRALAIQRVSDGEASLLYISPEMLRSKTIETILMGRHVVRFVIDEAHCFSSWGHDFRVDYLYIGKFIAKYQQAKRLSHPIAVSCFTATAKQKVIQDISDYFRNTLGLELKLFASRASRKNLRYAVIHADTDEDKYQKLRTLVSEHLCPTIVYVSRVKRTYELATKLSRDGLKALPFNGKMDAEQKVANQEAFMTDQVSIIVATSAFGMGVDKKDVGLVVHYDISDSLENYVQEAGRAGRDPHLDAKCYVLYGDNDLDKHFILLNQNKLSISEIQQVWKAVKDLTRQRPRVCCSALEIARQAGWDDTVSDIETRVRNALSALEQSGYIERGNNVPHVYATGITVKNMDEARQRLTQSPLFAADELERAIRIIKSLISQKAIAKAQDPEAESRIDYLADILGLTKHDVVSAVVRMRQEGILADSRDISAYLNDSDTSERKSRTLLERFARLERYILSNIPDSKWQISCKQLNDNAVSNGINTASEKAIRTLLNFLTVKGYTRKKEDAAHNLELSRQTDLEKTISRFEKRLEICRFAVEWLYRLAARGDKGEDERQALVFSIVQLLNDLNQSQQSLFAAHSPTNLEDVEEALLYLSRIGALKLEGGFMVLYNAMDIKRIKDNKFRYKQEDYRMLDEFYKLRIQQVHIVGEYANLMVRDYDAALQFVQDYFQMDYKKFVAQYFRGERVAEMKRNVTPKKYAKLFGQLSQCQMDIIQDKQSRCIVVAAGPGSGKTRVLVHKLASLFMLEDVKHEQLLMLTFSRAAATEFKLRLMQLIGNAAHFVEIKTFHSYCFDLLGRIGSLEGAKDVIARATTLINQGEVEPNRISKTVLVIDEAQDMSQDEYALVAALMARNEEMRVIAVGDDDQNIFEFRGSDSKYMLQLARDSQARVIEMTENYRSTGHVVACANAFVSSLGQRLKSTPITSMSQQPGWVSVTHHRSADMYTPLVEQLLQQQSGGTTCVLTQTNEEAVIIAALLRRMGQNSQLVQSLDGFRFANLAEVRYFVKQIDRHRTTPIITEATWQLAKQMTLTRYATSQCIGYLNRCLDVFEQANRTKYYNDFREFIFESPIEDFCDLTAQDVVVSTIHKAKGKEFDNVYMLIADLYRTDAALMRRYYVGMTRAKKHLFIHTNTRYFDRLPADRHTIDQNQYPLPDEIVLQLTHRDVYLQFFMQHKRDVLCLRSGDKLELIDNTLYDTARHPVAQLSSSMQQTLAQWQERGYRVQSASVRYIVAWKPKDVPKSVAETGVLLPDLVLVHHGVPSSEK